mmetsp:Transcript_36168/g.83085  ORF Transcript_36168/g.83085 Transcript_36168/m.83085 type:complete len:297 (-) Transcript_36168:2497-3387(-)
MLSTRSSVCISNVNRPTCLFVGGREVDAKHVRAAPKEVDVPCMNISISCSCEFTPFVNSVRSSSTKDRGTTTSVASYMAFSKSSVSKDAAAFRRRSLACLTAPLLAWRCASSSALLSVAHFSPLSFRLFAFARRMSRASRCSLEVSPVSNPPRSSMATLAPSTIFPVSCLITSWHRFVAALLSSCNRWMSSSVMVRMSGRPDPQHADFSSCINAASLSYSSRRACTSCRRGPINNAAKLCLPSCPALSSSFCISSFAFSAAATSLSDISLAFLMSISKGKPSCSCPSTRASGSVHK